MDTEDDPPMSSAEMEKQFIALLDTMDADTRLAFEKMVFWNAERGKNAPPLGMERMEQMIEEIRLENIRRRLGGKVGQILPFHRSK